MEGEKKFFDATKPQTMQMSMQQEKDMFDLSQPLPERDAPETSHLCNKEHMKRMLRFVDMTNSMYHDVQQFRGSTEEKDMINRLFKKKLQESPTLVEQYKNEGLNKNGIIKKFRDAPETKEWISHQIKEMYAHRYPDLYLEFLPFFEQAYDQTIYGGDTDVSKYFLSMQKGKGDGAATQKELDKVLDEKTRGITEMYNKMKAMFPKNDEPQ